MKGKKLIAQINILPFVDVVLVILVFFMITVGESSNPQRFEIDLPKVTSQDTEKTEQTQWVLVLDANSELFIESGLKSKQGNKLKKENLANFITKNKPNSDNFSIYIKADKNLLYSDVLQLMSSIHEAGVFKVGLVTSKEL